MKFSKFIAAAAVAVVAVGASNTYAQSLSPSTKWNWDKGTIVVEDPVRAEGQQDVLGLALPKMKTVRVGFVGLGMRLRNLTQRPGRLFRRRDRKSVV